MVPNQYPHENILTCLAGRSVWHQFVPPWQLQSRCTGGQYYNCFLPNKNILPTKEFFSNSNL